MSDSADEKSLGAFKKSTDPASVLSFWSSLDVPQAGFVLAKDLGDMEKMKPEDRNELLRTNKDVVLVTLQAFSQLEKVLTLDQIQHCIKLKYGKECDLRLAHSQAGSLKSLAQHVIRESKKTKESRVTWMKELKDSVNGKLLAKKFQRSKNASSESSTPTRVDTASGLPEIAPPSTAVLEAVVGKIMADPPKMDPTDQYKKKFRLRIKQKAQPGASDDPPKARPSLMMWPTEEAATAPMEEYHGLSAVGADGLLSAIPGRISSGTDPDADVGESGMESADAEPQEEDEADAGEAEENDAEQPGEDDAEQAEEDDAEQHEEDDAEQQEDDAEQHEEDDAEQAEEDAAAQNEHKKSESEEAPAKKVKRNEDGPLWGAMQAFIRHAKKEHGKSFREAQTLWKHSLIRAVLVDNISDKKRRRLV
ncbi:unnamed protein product [Symbiodinium sp. KB8]|nr:unnamed protein product [Symbiodinium sp. KB8]